MREIKFRVFDGIRITTNGIMFNNSTGCIDVPSGSVVMQYTGLKDRNGNEIYEGDIIFRTDVYSEVKQTIIYWNAKFIASNRKRPEGNAWKSDNGKSYDLSFLLNLNNDWRVIGNIYENPELINL